uniref:Uncharacterized protein n=1 Tax=Rhodnius prolixus TaxID=13249 RepID=T1HX60_RHOPR
MKRPVLRKCGSFPIVSPVKAILLAKSFSILVHGRNIQLHFYYQWLRSDSFISNDLVTTSGLVASGLFTALPDYGQCTPAKKLLSMTGYLSARGSYKVKHLK